MAAQQLALLLDAESLTLEPFASGDELKQVRRMGDQMGGINA